MNILARWFGARGQSRNRLRRTDNKTRLHVERLEARELLAANLTAYRPVTEYIKYANYPVDESVEESVTNGPGIRINGDDDNSNGQKDYRDTTATTAENDLVLVKVGDSGGVLSWTGSLYVWTTNTKSATVAQGAAVTPGQELWVEYAIESQPLASDLAPALTLTVSSSDTDTVVFHTFQSTVLAIGGNQQDPWNYVNPDILNNSQLGVYKIAGTLYQQGYDVHLYAHSQISSKSATIGKGAAYDEVVSAITNREVKGVAIYGYSWGGGATYNLAKGLNANTTLATIAPQYLKYTAYIDGITQGSISSERRLPPGTQHHDNYYQRKDWLVKGDSVVPASVTVINVNVNTNNDTRSWGKNLVHTTIDDSTALQVLIVGTDMGGLKSKVKR